MTTNWGHPRTHVEWLAHKTSHGVTKELPDGVAWGRLVMKMRLLLAVIWPYYVR